MNTVSMSSAEITERDIQAVVAVLRSGRLALGPQTRAFEAALADFVGTKHAIAVNSGTSGLHLVVRALGLGPGDDVLVPSFTFAASVNAILFEGATPVFVDIEPETYNLDPADLARWSEEVKQRFSEDAAEFLGPVEESRVQIEGGMTPTDGNEEPEGADPDDYPSDVKMTPVTEDELRAWLAAGDSDLIDLLREEISDHLDMAGRWVQEINDLPLTHPTWGEVGRFFHTMAGSAATVGLDEFGGRSRLIEESIGLAETDPDMSIDNVKSVTMTTLQTILAVIERRKAHVDIQIPQVDAETLADFRDESHDLFERIAQRIERVRIGSIGKLLRLQRSMASQGFYGFHGSLHADGAGCAIAGVQETGHEQRRAVCGRP